MRQPPSSVPIINEGGYINSAWNQLILWVCQLLGERTAGDIEITDDGQTWTIADGAVTHAKLDLPQVALNLLDDTTVEGQRTTLGLGTIATQDADDVNITGGSASGMTSVSAATLVATDNIVASKTKGEGLKIDPAAPTYAWVDLIGNITVRTTGATSPNFNVYRGSIRQYQCVVGTTEFFNEFHVPHDYAGTDIYIHVHWSQIVVDTGGAAGAPGDVKFYFEVTYAKGHNQAAFIAPVTTSIVQTASGTQYQHMIAEVQLSAASPSASQLDTDDIEVDGLIMVRTYRDSADPADTLNQQPFVHFIDIHYQSTGIGTKQKAPDFWT